MSTHIPISLPFACFHSIGQQLASSALSLSLAGLFTLST
jgi:hypothetical protein